HKKGKGENAKTGHEILCNQRLQSHLRRIGHNCFDIQGGRRRHIRWERPIRYLQRRLCLEKTERTMAGDLSHKREGRISCEASGINSRQRLLQTARSPIALSVVSRSAG